jgi:transcriptional regulator with XRE-family HTH domain
MKLTLDAWRRARGLSQEAMADAAGVHINTYRSWEQNPGEMRYDKALKIVNRLGISLDDILLPENTTDNSKTEVSA